jgi:hypothetical protein
MRCIRDVSKNANLIVYERSTNRVSILCIVGTLSSALLYHLNIRVLVEFTVSSQYPVTAEEYAHHNESIIQGIITINIGSMEGTLVQ